jgi:hypothetical protein
MHLGLIDGPFVPHNLISTQESPVPLPKFQTAPRLKILMASGFKKEPRYTFIASQKSRQTNSLQVPQQGPYKERGPSTRHFAYLSKTSSFGFPSTGVLPQGPLNGIPRREMPHHLMNLGPKKGTQIYFSNLPKVPAENPLQVPQRGPHGERGPSTGNLASLSKTPSFGFPGKEAYPPRVLFMESLTGRCRTTTGHHTHIYKRVEMCI